MAKSGLGRGLGALLGGRSPDAAAAEAVRHVPAKEVASTPKREQVADGVRRVPVDRLFPCPFQPRKEFTEEAIAELADSISRQGLIQPLLVRPKGVRFEIIAGERRFRAAQKAGIKELPVVVREADDQTVLELALVENLQRQDLNPIEAALGYQQLVEQYHLTQEQVADQVGKSRVSIANALRLLKLTPEAQLHVKEGRLSVGHAKVILALRTPEEQNLAVEKILRDNLNVRETEQLVQSFQKRTKGDWSKAAGSIKTERDANTVKMEDMLREKFGSRVLLKYKKGKGAVQISFTNDEELERILQVAGIDPESL